jgi:hypothetical protein
MASFFRSTLREFLSLTDEQILARLAVAYANRGFTSQYTDQTLTWERDLRSLRAALKKCVEESSSAYGWGILLEFSIPRKELRIDVVLLINEVIAILEAKSGNLTIHSRRQIEEYALLLHYFHKASADKRIIPVLVSPDADLPSLDAVDQFEMFPQLAAYWICKVIQSPWAHIPNILLNIARNSGAQADANLWDASAYHPVPSIIDAAMALRSGLSIREIAHSEASEHEIEMVRNAIQRIVDDARAANRHAICFLTGVPGSGKTLIGLALAHSRENSANAIHFMSGNGPLVKVLQHLFTQESRKAGANVSQARTEARTLIENVHVFARNYTDEDQRCPSNHAIIFDEAQRAWNRNQNRRKFNRDYSEPDMLLRIMERHEDWAAVIALVGGGQEINDGEAGLEEWGRALASSDKQWHIYASPEVMDGGASTAGHHLFDQDTPSRSVSSNDALHLRTSNRSLRAEKLATWVNHVVDGKPQDAASIGVTAKFPIFLSRDLEEVRAFLKSQAIGQNRFGLVGSSGAARLRAEGLEPNSSFHADYPWEHWYLAERSDVRSSFQCEVFATEFEIQGLELDWIGVCWGGDFVWSDLNQAWALRTFRPGVNNRWLAIKNPEKRNYRKNAYRVLLTRARQGMIIFVPKGNLADPSNSPEQFESTADYLMKCGVMQLSLGIPSHPLTEPAHSDQLLFR